MNEIWKKRLREWETHSQPEIPELAGAAITLNLPDAVVEGLIAFFTHRGNDITRYVQEVFYSGGERQTADPLKFCEQFGVEWLDDDEANGFYSIAAELVKAKVNLDFIGAALVMLADLEKSFPKDQADPTFDHVVRALNYAIVWCLARGGP